MPNNIQKKLIRQLFEDGNTRHAYQMYFNKKPSNQLVSLSLRAPKKLVLEAVGSQDLPISKDIYCVFNPNSVENLVREKDQGFDYLDEVERKTEDTKTFIACLKRFCIILSSGKVKSNIDLFFQTVELDMNDSETIAGNVMLVDFPFCIEKCSLDSQIAWLSSKTRLLGYNFVAKRVGDQTTLDGQKHVKTTLQFEASYFNSNVKRGDFLWHVTAKSQVPKILKRGLVAKDLASGAFNYPPRIYCFIDKNDELMKAHAQSSKKSSKRFILSSRAEDEVKDFYTEIQSKLEGKLYDTHEFAILKIDTSKIDAPFFRDNTSFDEDHNFTAVFTDRNIQPNAISLIAFFEVI